ncbi:MAG: FecR family protein [Mangrovibacterium sp.]
MGKTVKTARKIIHLLEDSHDHLSEGDIYALWMNIDRFENQQMRRSKIRRLKKVVHYAAVVLLLVSVSGLSTWYYFNSGKTYSFSGSGQEIQLPESRLILSNGNEIRLKKDHSTVAFKKEEVKINNDSIINLKDSHIEDANNKSLNEVIVPFGKRSQLVLEDGTKVWLNAGSRLAFPTRFDRQSRVIYLEGEAYFEVVHHEKQPFLVNVNDVEVRVLGTSFNVSAYSADALIETVLLEGKVAIRESGSLGFLKKEIVLNPNQKAVYNKEQKTTRIMDLPNADISIDWVKGWFSFSQRSLVDVLMQLQRYYNVKFEYDPGFISNELITGKLDLKDSLDDILLFLSDLAKVEFRINDHTVFVEKKTERLPMKKN